MHFFYIFISFTRCCCVSYKNRNSTSTNDSKQLPILSRKSFTKYISIFTISFSQNTTQLTVMHFDQFLGDDSFNGLRCTLYTHTERDREREREIEKYVSKMNHNANKKEAKVKFFFCLIISYKNVCVCERIWLICCLLYIVSILIDFLVPYVNDFQNQHLIVW